MDAKSIYFADEFRSFMKSAQGLTDDDFKKIMPDIKVKILNSNDKDPIKIFYSIMDFISQNWHKQTPAPVHADWHHFIVPGVLLAALRNAGYEVTDKDIEEGMQRGEKFFGGSCGFAGTCGGAYGAGIALSIFYKINPLYDEKRSEIMEIVSDILKEIAKYKRRCCKRSSLIAVKKVIDYLNNKNIDKIQIVEHIRCKWCQINKMCLGKDCVFNMQ